MSYYLPLSSDGVVDSMCGISEQSIKVCEYSLFINNYPSILLFEQLVDHSDTQPI